MNRHSIITAFSLFFFLLLFFINTLLFFEENNRRHAAYAEEFDRLMRTMMHVDSDDSTHLGAIGLERADSATKKLDNAIVLLDRMDSKLLEFENDTYFLHCHPNPPQQKGTLAQKQPFHILAERSPDMLKFGPPPQTMQEHTCHLYRIIKTSQTFTVWPFWVGINVMLTLFYIFLIRKFLPLQQLREAITRLGEQEDTALKIKISGKDEIAQIAHAYNVSLEKIHALREARTLFLRNILHELKTPIMKAKLMSHYIPDTNKRYKMEEVFGRMEYLLHEFSNIEKFSSGTWQLKYDTYRLVDLIDHACDILLCESNLLKLKDAEHFPSLHVDFEFFAIALKNLLDNALKYSHDMPHIEADEREIRILSKGDRVETFNLESPFNRPFENSASGLGLGLYITNAIVRKHGFSLSYYYQDGMNYFIIKTRTA